eukprot:7391880-Prymnesium_polylepis.1
MEPEAWQAKAGGCGSPPQMENDVWRVAVGTKFGEDALHGFTMERVPVSELYADGYRLHAVREIMIAMCKGIGISDVSGPVGQPVSPADVLDEAIDRHDVHGLFPSLRRGVRVSSHELIVGVWGEYGAAIALARRSRDLTAPFPSTFVRAPSDALVEFQKRNTTYESLATRRREESCALIAGNPGVVPPASFPPPGLDACCEESVHGSSAAASGAGTQEAATGLAHLLERVATLEKKPSSGEPPPKGELGPLVVKGDVFSRKGGTARHSKAKVIAALKALDVDPDTVCIPWLLAQGSNVSADTRWKDCRNREAHKKDPSFHRTITGLKLSTCRCDDGAGKAGAWREAMAGGKRKEQHDAPADAIAPALGPATPVGATGLDHPRGLDPTPTGVSTPASAAVVADVPPRLGADLATAATAVACAARARLIALAAESAAALLLALQSQRLGEPGAPLDLVIGEFSGRCVSRIDAREGPGTALSCDPLPTEGAGLHFQGDARQI